MRARDIVEIPGGGGAGYGGGRCGGASRDDGE